MPIKYIFYRQITLYIKFVIFLRKFYKNIMNVAFVV